MFQQNPACRNSNLTAVSLHLGSDDCMTWFRQNDTDKILRKWPQSEFVWSEYFGRYCRICANILTNPSIGTRNKFSVGKAGVIFSVVFSPTTIDLYTGLLEVMQHREERAFY